MAKSNRIVVLGKDEVERRRMMSERRQALATERAADGIEEVLKIAHEANERAVQSDRTARRANSISVLSLIVAALVLCVNVAGLWLIP